MRASLTSVSSGGRGSGKGGGASIRGGREGELASGGKGGGASIRGGREGELASGE